MVNLYSQALADICIVSALYGIYLVFFVGSLYIIFLRYRVGNRNDLSRPMNGILLAVSIVLFLLITSQWIILIDRLFTIFIYPIRLLVLVSLSADSVLLFIVEIIVMDITMVYRLYLIWGRNWHVIIAPMLTIATVLVAVILLRTQIVLGPWPVVVCTAELVTNLFVTVLMIYRIQVIRRSTRSSVGPLIRILVESTGILTIALVLVLVTGIVQSSLGDLFMDICGPAGGIAFSLIVVRVGVGVSTEEHTIADHPRASDIENGQSSSVTSRLSTRHLEGLPGGGGEVVNFS